MLFFFRTLVARRKFIVAATLVTAVIVAVVSLMLPKWYTAATSIFPPDQGGGVSMYAELLQTMQMPLLGQLGTGAQPETIFIDIMKSRHIGERLIDEFDLYGVYSADLVEDALDQLHSHTGYILLENGIIKVTFEDQDPKRAADIANRYVELLDEFNRRLNVTRASKTKEFIERQIEERRAELAKAELELKQFQETHKALELEEQLRSAMTIVTDLTAQAIALESELKILEHYTSPTSEEYRQKKSQYEGVVEQLQKLKLNHNQDEDDLLRAYIPTLENVPELALQMMRLKRRVGIETAVYTMLVKEYEKSRIEEARDTPTVQIMDKASVPNLRSRPRRKALVVLGAMIGFGWSAFLSLLLAAWRENKDRSRILSEVLEPIVADFSRIFRRR
jgi:uncharacterized protein involved in exopolysaccharide biosynthesis